MPLCRIILQTYPETRVLIMVYEETKGQFHSQEVLSGLNSLLFPLVTVSRCELCCRVAKDTISPMKILLWESFVDDTYPT